MVRNKPTHVLTMDILQRWRWRKGAKWIENGFQQIVDRNNWMSTYKITNETRISIPCPITKFNSKEGS